MPQVPSEVRAGRELGANESGPTSGKGEGCTCSTEKITGENVEMWRRMCRGNDTRIEDQCGWSVGSVYEKDRPSS